MLSCETRLPHTEVETFQQSQKFAKVKRQKKEEGDSKERERETRTSGGERERK